VRISLEVGTSDTLLPSLLRGDFDVVIGRLPDQSDSQELNIELLDSDEQMRVVARAGHPLAAASALALADLVDLTWILHPIGSPMRRRVENALQAAGMVQSLDIVETASILATTAMLEASDMIAVVPNDVAEHYARYGMVAILPVELPISMINLGLLTLRSRPRSVALDTLLHYLRAH
jgi:DNA-binding transcriptional LysR family regulator